jgi:thiosulfate dehydrogenase
MQRNKIISALGIIIISAIAGGALSVIFSRFIDFSETSRDALAPQKIGAAVQPGMAAVRVEGVAAFNPPSLESAPADIKDAVMLGHNILTNTRKYAGGYVGNKLTCSNCHFKGGVTRGGENGGLSLVGVGATYPAYKKRQNYAVHLITRTNDCFQRSMNGRPLPADSREMTAIVTYYQWISKGLPIYGNIPWPGLKHLKNNHRPDKTKGTQVFAQKCAVCHGTSGQGPSAAPPLWGNDSFNDGAGMAKPANLAAFAHFNMPLGNPDLSVEDALDVAAFVSIQPRRHFTVKSK